MVSICYRMCDGDIDRHIDLAAAFFIPAHDNDGEVCRLSVRDAAAAAGKRRPRRTGYAVEIRRLVRLGLDALDILVGLHICGNGVVKREEILGKVRPAVGKRAVIRMKECEIRHDFIPDTEFAVRVFEHAEVLDAAQRLGDAVNRRCVEFIAVCMTETEQVLHIHRRRHVEFDLESLGIIAVVLTARPAFHIDFFEGLHSIPSFPNPDGYSDYTGKIEIDGTEVKQSTLSDIRKKIGYVFQDSDSQLFMSNVYEDIAFAPRNYGYSEEEVEKSVAKAMEMVNIENLKDRMIYQLSGGQKKLVSLATILSIEPEIILFDEPSVALDPKNRRNLINILNSIKGIKIIASHDLDMILDTCNRAILISKGKIIKDGNTENILSDKNLLEENGLELPLSFGRK